jgi:hypothetical protein
MGLYPQKGYVILSGTPKTNRRGRRMDIQKEAEAAKAAAKKVAQLLAVVDPEHELLRLFGGRPSDRKRYGEEIPSDTLHRWRQELNERFWKAHGPKESLDTANPVSVAKEAYENLAREINRVLETTVSDTVVELAGIPDCD